MLKPEVVLDLFIVPETKTAMSIWILSYIYAEIGNSKISILSNLSYIHAGTDFIRDFFRTHAYTDSAETKMEVFVVNRSLYGMIHADVGVTRTAS